MARKTASLILALFLLAALLPAPAHAAGGVTMAVEVGWEGKYVVGCPTPVVVTIRNDGPEFTGSLELLTGTGFNVLVRRDVVLPQGTEKRFTLFMLASGILGPKDFEVTLKKGGSAVASAVPQAAAGVDPGTPLGGILSGDPAALSYMKLVSPSQGGARSWVDLTADGLYENADLMRSFGVIAVDQFDASALTDAQRNAIRQWVYSGGTLILGAGPGREGAAASWKDYLGGVTFEGASTESALSSLVSLANGTAFQGALPVSGVRGDGWNTVASSGAGAPLILSRGFGRGTVLLAAFGLGEGAMGSWLGGSVMWQTLVDRYAGAAVGQYYNSYGYYGGNSGMLMALQSGFAGGLTFWLFMAMLLVFTALAGFGSFFILRAIGRQKLMWAAVPALAALFSALMLFLGRTNFGRPPDMFAYTATDISGGVALSERTLGFIAPSMGDYRVEVDGAGLLFPDVTPDYYYNATGQAQPRLPVTTIASADGAALRYLNVNLNGTRSARFSSFSGQSPLEVSFSYDGKNVNCRLKNVSGAVIEDVAVAIGGSVRIIGDLAPGGEQEAAMELDQTPLEQSVWDITGKLYPNLYGGGMFSPYRTGSKRDDLIRSAFLQDRLNMLMNNVSMAMPAAQPASGSGMWGRALVMGWIGKPFDYTVKVNGRAVKPRSLELVTALVPISTAASQEGSLELAKAYGQLSSSPAGASGGSMKGDVLIVEPGDSAVLDFPLADAAALDLSDLYFESGQQQGMAAGTWSIYDWSAQAWDATASRQHFSRDELVHYVDASGLVRVSVKAGQNEYIECTPYVWAQGVGK